MSILLEPEVKTTSNLTHSDLLNRIYARRGIVSVHELDNQLALLLPYHTLSNIEKAAARIGQAIMQQQRILIIGDFDTDGATSTALAVTVLQAFGAKAVEFLVPDRFVYGYGLSPEIVKVAADKNPDLIITVDNGISSHAGVETANALNIDVIVTDHHLAADTLPKAYAIVNPNLTDDAFASKNLAGVGVIFYVMLAVRAFLEQQAWFENQQIPRPNLAQWLDLVALGTVADMVKLDHNNRILVHNGLMRIRSGHTRPGILALLQIAGREPARLQANDLGFFVGPRLNAAGRLEDMSLGIACLMADSLVSALPMAQQLQALNQERKVIETQMQQEAFAIIEQLNLSQQLPVGICLFDANWHQGIVGLVASRVKDKMHRPVIAFAETEGNLLKGSARSVLGIHIRDILAAIAAQYPHLINKFGGHAMAAGLTIATEHYAEFAKVFAETIFKSCDSSLLQRQNTSDGELAADEFSLEIAEILQKAGPWGQGFEEPLFTGSFEVKQQRPIGNNHLKFMLQPIGQTLRLDAIAFQVANKNPPAINCKKLECLYRLSVNEYRGQKNLQLLIEEFLQHGD